MRSSLSCEACRKSKVKCINTGSPPCRRCTRCKFESCTLSRPLGKAARPNRRQSGKRAAAVSVIESPGYHHEGTVVPEQPSAPTRSTQTASQGTDAPLVMRTHRGLYERDVVDRHMSRIPNSAVLKSLNIFSNQIPELAMLHLPTLLDALAEPCSLATKALLSAVLAVTQAHLSVLDASWADHLLPREHYACFAKDALSQLMLQPPDVQVVQALLIITLHEWGSREFHKAWVYCGVAIRIMQALHSLRVAPYPLDLAAERRNDSVSIAVETRTYWACFIMDCMINAGTYNPPMLPMSEMIKLRISRPLGTVEFALGPGHLLQAEDVATEPSERSLGFLDMTRGFEILAAGFDIWTHVMAFIFNDGRRAPGMCAPKNCPWVEASPWSASVSRLKAWRFKQHCQLQYPTNSVAVHKSLGFGETFVYLNLLYYVSTLMLHREYFPFLPTADSVPRGPVEQPFLEAEAPAGWWEESASELFGAADHIARLLHEASECGVYLMTPFAGFCAFSAGYVNLYIYSFPRMNLGHSPEAHSRLQMCLQYLQEFRKVWPIADGWMKTINHASLLYEKALGDRQKYQGRSRADFDTLHQSIHEFRVVDRSDKHNEEINDADMAGPADPSHSASATGQDPSPDSSALLNQLLVEVSSNLDEQGAWSQWWPPFEEVDLPQMENHDSTLL